jgi:hypothetical protein
VPTQIAFQAVDLAARELELCVVVRLERRLPLDLQLLDLVS